MAGGGMTPPRRGLNAPTLAERMSADRRTRHPNGDLVVDPALPARTRHVLVRLPAGPPREGLVLEWARAASDRSWSARVVYVIDDPYGHSRVIEEWLRAGVLLPVSAASARQPAHPPDDADAAIKTSTTG
jgi:hypothetical protein